MSVAAAATQSLSNRDIPTLEALYEAAGGVNFTTPEIKPSATNQMYVFALP